MSVINKLTEGIRERSLAREGEALLTKWEKTGLLEGLNNEVERKGMAVLLENQAKQLVSEASSTGGGTGSRASGGSWSGGAAQGR